MKRFLSQFPYRGGVSKKPRRKLFVEKVTSHDPFDRSLTSTRHGFRDHWIENQDRQSQEFKEFSPGEKEKYEHKFGEKISPKKLDEFAYVWHPKYNFRKDREVKNPKYFQSYGCLSGNYYPSEDSFDRGTLITSSFFEVY